jgi:OFA family oxalate/formate antiporter-like MFS transporter
MMLFTGVIYAWYILKAPYLTEFGWSQGALGLNFTVTMWCFCFGGILGGALVKRLPLRLIVSAPAAVVCLGFWLSGSLSGGAVWQLYLSYGVMCGLGIGVLYNVIISCVMGWFPDKRGTVSGVLMMGFGASSLVLGSAIGVLMNSLGWRAVYRGLGVCILLVLGIGAVLLSPPPETKPKPAGAEADTSADFATAEMLRRFSYWRFYLFLVLLSSIGACVISLAKDISVSAGAGESLAIVLTGALSVCNGLGRILCGALFDKIGAKTIRLAAIIALLASGLLLISSITGAIFVLAAGIALAGVSYGFMPTLTSGYIGKVYGARHFPVNFSVTNTIMLFASFSAPVAGWLYGATGDYRAVFLLLLVFAVFGAALGETLRKT